MALQPTTTIKELRINVTVTLPPDLFEQAQLTGRVQEALKAFEGALRSEVGATFAIDNRVVSVSTKARSKGADIKIPAGPVPWASSSEVDETGRRSEEAHSPIPF